MLVKGAQGAHVFNTSKTRWCTRASVAWVAIVQVMVCCLHGYVITETIDALLSSVHFRKNKLQRNMNNNAVIVIHKNAWKVSYGRPEPFCPDMLLIRCMINISSIQLGLYSHDVLIFTYCKISWSIEAARSKLSLFQSLWNLAHRQQKCLSNFRAMRSLWHSISRLRVFTRFAGKTSNRSVNWGTEDKQQ